MAANFVCLVRSCKLLAFLNVFGILVLYATLSDTLARLGLRIGLEFLEIKGCKIMKCKTCLTD